MKTVIKVVFAIILFTSNIYAQVGINTTAPGSGSILDISASDKGVLFPKVALTSTIVEAPVTSPSMGLLIFNTATSGLGDTAVTPGFYYWDTDESEWMRFTSGEQGNHYVGELYGGGIVFYVYQNGEHGLIASFDDLDGGLGAEWGADGGLANAQSWWDGATNTTTAVDAGADSTDAVSLCNDYTNDGYSDWHLPSIGELKSLEEAAYVLFKELDSDDDSNTNAPNYSGQYWSSTSYSGAFAYSFKFTNTHTEVKDRNSSYLVRAVRAF